MLKPDQIIALFEKLSSKLMNQQQHIYMYYVNMNDSKSKEVESYLPDFNLIALQSTFRLKDAGKHYNLESDII